MLPPDGWIDKRKVAPQLDFPQIGTFDKDLKENCVEPSLIIQDLASQETAKQRAAAQACAKDPMLAQGAAIPLCRAVSASDERVVEWSTAALEGLGPPSSEDLDALVELFSESEATAYWAVTLVGRLKQTAFSAGKKLAATVDAANTPTEVRNRAIWALGQIEATGPEIEATLQKAAQSSNPRTARLAAKALNQG